MCIRDSYIGVLLKYDENDTKWQSRIENPKAKRAASGEKIRLGLIGAGNFVRSTMLPIMKETGLFEFRGLATTGGVGGAQANDGTPFGYTTNNYQELLSDPEIDLIAVSTQHNSPVSYTHLDVYKRQIRDNGMISWSKVVIVIAVIALILLIWKKAKDMKTILAYLPMLLVAAYPYIWYLVMSNHSQIHYWYTYRNQVLTLFAGLIFLASILKSKNE